MAQETDDSILVMISYHFLSSGNFQKIIFHLWTRAGILEVLDLGGSMHYPSALVLNMNLWSFIFTSFLFESNNYMNAASNVTLKCHEQQ